MRFLLIGLFFLAQSQLRGAVLWVTSSADSGLGSLREQLSAAQAGDTIQFQIIGLPPFTISLVTALPTNNVPITIDATTQLGYVDRPLVELNGAATPALTSGFLILSGGTTIRGLAINRFPRDGIRIEGGGTNVIEGNFIGLGLSGNSDAGNAEGGITIYQSPNNVIGGVTAAKRNIISGQNLTGIYIINPPSTGNRVIGNFIGTDITGRIDRGNQLDGILISDAAQNTIGGLTAGERNIISGNNESGVYIAAVNSFENQVLGNYIGTDVTGTSPLGNSANGVTIYRGSFNKIGSTETGARNVISGNGQRGVFLYFFGTTGNTLEGNFIGTDLTGSNRLANAFAGVGLLTASGNVIGGTDPAARNIISGNNQSGVTIQTNSLSNVVLGNYIGVDVTGARALGNLFSGVSISFFCSGNVVGGTAAGAGNVISANSQRGIFFGDPGTTGNQVLGNLIGTDATGHMNRGNALAGVWIESDGNLIGNTSPSARNVISGNGQSGVFIYGALASSNSVQGNFIGTDINGTQALANNFGGVNIVDAEFNLIGGAADGARNIISGNISSGIYFQGTAGQNTVQGNYIGANVSGMAAVPNGKGGIYFYGSANNTIGGTATGAGNLISGNFSVALSLGDPGCVGNLIQGNAIGVKADRKTAMPNSQHGIDILNTSSNNIIGGVAAGAGNIIAFAQTALYAGVRIRDGCARNVVRGNSIFSNNGLGIDLGTNGPSLNDLNDTDAGANDLQNFPVLSSASGRYITVVQGALSSRPSKTFKVDFYASVAPDSSTYGEGQQWLGAVDATTSAGGAANFTISFTNTLPLDRYISATATDPNNNTSEFSITAVLPTVSSGDADGDGMPNDYEIAAHLNPNNPSDATGDSDSDGASNLDEYKAGTDPLDASSVLRLAPLVKNDSGARLRFQTAAEKTYQLEYSADLMNWNLVPGTMIIVGDRSTYQATDTAAAPQRFYRVHLLP